MTLSRGVKEQDASLKPILIALECGHIPAARPLRLRARTVVVRLVDSHQAYHLARLPGQAMAPRPIRRVRLIPEHRSVRQVRATCRSITPRTLHGY